MTEMCENYRLTSGRPNLLNHSVLQTGDSPIGMEIADSGYDLLPLAD